MVKKLEASKQWVERYQVDSLTSDDESYTVSKKIDGTWACSCKRWIFHKAPKVNCKHIGAVLSSFEWNAVGGFGPMPAPKRSAVEMFAEGYFGQIPVMATRMQMYEFAEKFAESRGSAIIEKPSVEVEEATVGEFKITRKFRLNA